MIFHWRIFRKVFWKFEPNIYLDSLFIAASLTIFSKTPYFFKIFGPFSVYSVGFYESTIANFGRVWLTLIKGIPPNISDRCLRLDLIRCQYVSFIYAFGGSLKPVVRQPSSNRNEQRFWWNAAIFNHFWFKND